MRVAGIELRRTGALPVAIALTVLGIVLTITHQPPFSRYGTWSASWAAGGRWINDTDIVLGPLAAVAAAWVGGRERRRGMTELIGSTPRSALRRSATTWTALAAGVLLGMIGFALFVTAGIAPSVSYGGGRWPLSWSLVVGGVITCTALGFAAGRLVPGRLVAPSVGVLIYLVAGVVGYGNGGWAHLVLVANLPLGETTQLRASTALEYSGWLVALTATLLLLAASRAHRRSALAVLLVAVLLATLLGTTSGAVSSRRDAWVEDDPAASRLVCTRSTPTVCTTRVHAGLLAALTPTARGLLAEASRVLPVGRAVEGASYGGQREVGDGTLTLENLDGRALLLRRGLAEPERIAPESVSNLVGVTGCSNAVTATDSFARTAFLLEDVAAGLILGRPAPYPFSPEPQRRRLSAFLTAEPGRARAWLSDYLDASTHCDLATLRDLASTGG